MADTININLRAFFQAVGSFGGQRALLSAPLERETIDTPVIMLETERSKVEALPLDVGAYLDGIQASLLITHKEHRPIYLCYSAAGAVAGWNKLLGIREQLEIVCSEADREWLNEIRQGLELSELNTSSPPDLERAALAFLGKRREELEKELAQDLVDEDFGYIVVDGSLTNRPYQRDMVGVVKTTLKRYLPDESVLYGMPAGWRSPRFKIPAGYGSKHDRYSCYVRMFDASSKAWSFGLVRLETYIPELLEPLAARCLEERQSPAGGDPRFDRHLRSIKSCEEMLRARRPSIFTLEV